MALSSAAFQLTKIGLLLLPFSLPFSLPSSFLPPSTRYGALIGGRAIMVTDSAVWLKAATTIAVRYLALRCQGDPLAPGCREPQLIDFRTVQTRVMPLVATA